MKDLVDYLQELVAEGIEWVDACDGDKMALKHTEYRWSKKEILGHLIDSALNNLRRFTEIQFEDKPYPIIGYNQDELVKVNDYQNAQIQEILNLWKSLNQRIAILISKQSDETLSYEIIFGKGKLSNLKFLMTDYVDHMSHHLNQIMEHK
ncbi:MAG: putative damage-inducible protein DinB [Saprospiraceae bacterium]|jgi:uncharacterized damage-inducible protein DinB